MGVSERLRDVVDASGLTLKAFSGEIGIAIGTFEKYLNEDRAPSAKALVAIRSRFGVSSDWILTGEGSIKLQNRSLDGGRENLTSQEVEPDFVPIQRFSVEASAGPGALVDEETQTGFYAFNRRWLDRRQLDPGSLAVIAVRGDSMEPKLSDGDLILVDRAQRQIADGIAYVLRIDTDLLVKNVQRVRPGVIALLSANALYPPREIDAEGLDGEVEIIGRVVASMHEW